MTLKSSHIAAASAAAAGSGATLTASTTAAAPGPFVLILSGVIFSAQTGLDYRSYKRGEISKSEFSKRTKRGAFTISGALMGKTGGMVSGFFVGQAMIPFPVLGGIVGGVVGGIAGGLTGAKVSVKLYEKMEERQAEKQNKLVESEESK